MSEMGTGNSNRFTIKQPRTLICCSYFFFTQGCHAICTLLPNNFLSSSKRQRNTPRHAIFASFQSWALQHAAPWQRFLPGGMPLWSKDCSKRSNVQLVCSEDWLNELADEETKGFHGWVIELSNRFLHISVIFSSSWCIWDIWRALKKLG